MAKQRLTDRIITNSVGLNDLIHIVKTGDTSQNPAGSSYATTIGNIVASSSGSTVSGLTFSNLTYDLTLSLDNGVTFNSNLSILASDIKVTGGTYNPSLGEITFVNNSGGTFVVSGITSNFLSLSGGTVTGTTNFTNGLSANTISATTLFVNGIQITGDTYVTGGTYSNGTLIFTNNQGNDFQVTGVTEPFTGGTVSGVTIFSNGLSANTISATTIGSSGDCVDDIYVSNIHSCSPLNINPLDEGNVYFGSTSGVTIDLSNKRIGIGTSTPVAPIEIYSNQPNVAIPNQIKFSQAGGNIKFAAYDATISDFFGITLSTNYNQRPVRVAGSSGLYVGSTTAVPTPAGYILVEGNVGIGLSGTTAKLHINNTTSGNTFLAEDSTNPDSSPFVIDASGNTGIGTTTPSEKLDVSGKTKTTNLQVTSGATNGYVLTSDASGNASWQPSSGGGSGTTVTAFTYSDNNFTISQVGETDLITNISVMTGLTINGNFNVNGNSVLSGSGQNVLTIIGSGNSISSPLFSIQGSSGELFSISDNLIGELFSVNDISGLPVLRAFDDDTVLIGSYQAPSLHSSVRLIPSIGLTTAYTLPLSAYTGAWFDYTVKNSSGARAGQIMSIFSGSSVNFTETTTTDFGSTTPITFNFISDGTNASLRVSATTSNWEVKIIVRSI